MIFVLLVLAVARVTRFITADVLFDPVRKWAIRGLVRRNEDSKIAYLISCDWCASIYVGAAFAGAWYAWGESMAFMAVCAALAASYVAGYLNTRAGD